MNILTVSLVFILSCRSENQRAIINRRRELTFFSLVPINIIRYLKTQFKNIILTYSGGTDSTLLLLLIAKFGDLNDLTSIVFNNTRLSSRAQQEYVETVIQKLSLTSKFTIIVPEKTRAELLELIKEDMASAKDKKHSKHLYRCCVEAKEKPFIKYLKDNDFHNEQTVVLRGIRAFESSMRFNTIMQLIRTGQVYYNRPRYSRKIFVSNPIFMVPDRYKEIILKNLCSEFHLPMPVGTGCVECPIFLKYASPEERKGERFQKTQKRLLGQEILDDFF